MALFAMLIALIGVITTGCGSKGGDDDNDDEGNPHNAMLNDLGVNTDLGTLKDPQGNEVRDNYNPLTKQNGNAV